MFKKKPETSFHIGVEIDGNKVVITEVTNGVISDVISVTLGSLRESWAEASSKYKKYMKNNLFTVSLSNKCLVFNNIKLDYKTLHQDYQFKEIVEVQENLFLRQEVFAASLAQGNDLLPTNNQVCSAILNGYNYNDLNEVLELLSGTQAQIVPTSFLFNKINYTVVYTGLENCFVSYNNTPRSNFILRSGGVLDNIQDLPDLDEDNTSLDRFLDVIDGNLLDIDALVKVANMVDNITNEVKTSTSSSREKFILAGILAANTEVRKTFESKGLQLETNIYENPVWGQVPFDDRFEVLASLLAAKNSEYLPRYSLVKESDLLYKTKEQKERKNNVKTHLIGAFILTLGVLLGLYPLMSSSNQVQRLQAEQSRLETRLSETDEVYSYYQDNLPELEVLQENKNQPLPVDAINQILRTPPNGVSINGFTYETIPNQNETNTSQQITIEAYGFNSPSVLDYWVKELNSNQIVSRAWVASYTDSGTNATYFIKIELASGEEEGLSSDYEVDTEYNENSNEESEIEFENSEEEGINNE